MYGLSLDSLTDDFLVQESESVQLQNDPRYELLSKIRDSMSEAGSEPASWDEVTGVYKRMRSFSIPEFELRLDHITDTDGWGKTKHARICIDGVFALFLYRGKKHVLTIGYSLARDKVLIGNVQAPKDTKGWGLQFLPKERLEYVIGLFQEIFVGYELYLVDGENLVDRLMDDYRRELCQATLELEQAKTAEEKRVAQNWCAEFRQCIAGMEKGRDRLVAIYRKTGRFKLSGSQLLNGLRYHRLVEQ